MNDICNNCDHANHIRFRDGSYGYCFYELSDDGDHCPCPSFTARPDEPADKDGMYRAWAATNPEFHCTKPGEKEADDQLLDVHLHGFKSAWSTLARKHSQLLSQLAAERTRREDDVCKPTVIKIIRLGIDGDVKRLRAYAGLLADKTTDEQFAKWIRKNIADDFDPGLTIYPMDAQAPTGTSEDGAEPEVDNTKS